jgi:hypothetical protein
MIRLIKKSIPLIIKNKYTTCFNNKEIDLFKQKWEESRKTKLSHDLKRNIFEKDSELFDNNTKVQNCFEEIKEESGSFKDFEVKIINVVDKDQVVLSILVFEKKE